MPKYELSFMETGIRCAAIVVVEGVEPCSHCGCHGHGSC